MMVVPAGVRVLVATRPVDFRKGMDGLAGLAREKLGQDPFAGTVLVFRAKRARLPRKMKTWPLNGSAPMICCTLAARPSKPARRSIG
jgi:hypothetical protein